jgi:hypothetical protein
MTLLYIAIAIVLVLGGMILHAYVAAPPTPNPLTDDVILDALRKGERNNALRWYMELHHTDLERTSQAINQLERDLQSKATS